MKKCVLVISFVVVWLGAVVYSAHGYTGDDKLSVSGYLQNQSSYRLGKDSGWVSSENRLQVEMVAKPITNFTVSGTVRGIYDAIYDLRSSSADWGHKYAGSRDAMSKEAKLRELYVDTSLGRWDFRIGKQQVVWGETDGLRLMDLVNPLDMRRQFTTRDWADIRIPLTLVKATYGIDQMSNTFLELLWNPGDIRRDLTYSDTTMSDNNSTPWNIPTPPSLIALQPLRAGGLVNVSADDPSWLNVRNSEFGGRLAGTLDGWFITLNYFQGFSKTPVVEGNLTVLEPMLAGFGPPPGSPPGSDLPIPFRFDFPRERVIGFAFNKAAGLWVWRGEFATYLDKHYNKAAIGLFLPNMSVVEKQLQASMLGFDYKRFINWLNPEKMFFISAQAFHYHIFNWDEEITDGPYGERAIEDHYYFSLLINTEYHKGRICPEVLAVYDANQNGWYVKPRVEFKYGDHWRPEIAALYFSGDQFELPWGAMSNKSEVYVRLKYLF